MTRSATRRRATKVVMPALVLAIAAIIFLALMSSTPELSSSEKAPVPVAVRQLEISPETINLTVQSQGSVQPRTEAKLIAQVEGTVTEISPALLAGALFSTGDVLVRLDPRDFEIKLARARARLDQAIAEANFAQSEADRIRSLYGEELVSIADLQHANRSLAIANASFNDASAAVQQAELDLERSVIKAPFNGRVRTKAVDLGQFLTKGVMIASIYDTETLEVRLPLADAQLAYLDASYATRGVATTDATLVTLSANYAGANQTWYGRLVRTEGDISTKSRFVQVIVEVKETTNANGVRLPIGLFVNATIEGKTVENTVVIPRSALRSNNTVMVIDANSRLRFRDVQILRLAADEVLISAGLFAGERISISPLQFVVDGMPVRVTD